MPEIPIPSANLPYAMAFIDVSFSSQNFSVDSRLADLSLQTASNRLSNKHSQHISPSRDAPRPRTAIVLSLPFPSLQCPGYAKQLDSPDSSLPLSLLPGSMDLPEDQSLWLKTADVYFFQSFGDPDVQKSKCGKVVLPSDLWGEPSLPLPVSGGLRDPQVYGCIVSTSA